MTLIHKSQQLLYLQDIYEIHIFMKYTYTFQIPLIGRHEEPYLPVLCHGMAHPDLACPVECSHRVIYLPVLYHGMPYTDLACHIEWSQSERKIFHCERFTCKFFNCMPHPTLHVILSAAIMRYLTASSVSWCATP